MRLKPTMATAQGSRVCTRVKFTFNADDELKSEGYGFQRVLRFRAN